MLSKKVFENVKCSEPIQIHFGHLQYELYDVDTFFNDAYSRKWLQDDLTRKIITDMCNAYEITEDVIKCPHWYTDEEPFVMTPRELASGVKALLLLLHTDYEFVCMSRCGDNGAKWLLEIARRKPIKITLNSVMTFREDFPMFVLNDGTSITTYLEYVEKVRDYCVLKKLPKEGLQWCRENAPEASKGLPDKELWNCMAETYYRNILYKNQ